ncbi:MAG: cell wall-binding repeat-containing protein [Coriobacteriia bacterium]|nr:cell wall-binding repeat-containing protein [Coriobacteriia bacterium]
MTRRSLARRVCALSVVFALLFSLAGAPLAAAGDTRGANIAVTKADPASAPEGLHTTRGSVTLPAPGDGASSTTLAPASTEDVFTHGMETWPGPWTVDSTGLPGSPTWGRTSHRKSEGTYSAYCAGSAISAPGPYANDMQAWMRAGPFDLSGYDEATLAFDMWLYSESDYDFIYVGVSTDGSGFDVLGSSGDSGGWRSEAFDLADFFDDGSLDLTGEPQVWIAFIFDSDFSDTYEGAYIDNVRVTAAEAEAPLPPVLSVAGDTRFETAVEASTLAYPSGAGTVVIATGRNWPDALGGSALAGALDAPILLTEPGSLPPAVAAEITRLKATHAVILGGTSAVATAVEDALKTKLTVERIKGTDRYDTANQVAARVKSEMGGAFDGTAFLATGGNFPDALAAAPLAAHNKWPLYLSHPTTGVSAATRAAMSGVTKVKILGGTAAISQAVQDSLAGSFSVSRIAGATRYDTAAQVAQYGVTSAGHMWNRVGIATGENYPDALAGGVLQGKAGSVMLLTPTASLCTEAGYKLLNNRGDISTVTFFGGTGAVSPATRTSVLSALAGTWTPPLPPPTGTGGLWEGYKTGYSSPVVLFNVQNGKITATGSTLQNGAAMIVVFPYTNVTMITYVYNDIPIGTDGKFAYTWGTVTTMGGQKWVNGTITSATHASGTATHSENSGYMGFTGNLTYDWVADR